jgi:hypothetical protein
MRPDHNAFCQSHLNLNTGRPGSLGVAFCGAQTDANDIHYGDWFKRDCGGWRAAEG